MTTRQDKAIIHALSPLLYVISVFIGATTGVIILIYWYLILNIQGVNMVSVGGTQIHHGLVGVLTLFIGAPLSVASNPVARIVGGFFFGLGLVVMGEDLIQHCIVQPAIGGGCSSIAFN